MIQNPYYVYINSRDRLPGGSDSNFQYNISFPPDVSFDRVVLLDALIPKSYYLVQDDGPLENVFQLKENSTTVTITIPIGSYLLNTFRTTIANLLTAASPNSLTYTVTYPASSAPDTGKFTYTSSNGSIQSSIITNEHFFEPLGFQRDSTNVFTGTTLISSTVIKLQSEDRLIIHSNCCQNGHDDILMSINSSTSVNYSSIVWQNPAPEYYSHILSSERNNVYSFSLTDEDNEVINIRGLNMNLTLLFYKIDPIIQQLRDFLKLAVSK